MTLKTTWVEGEKVKAAPFNELNTVAEEGKTKAEAAQTTAATKKTSKEVEEISSLIAQRENVAARVVLTTALASPLKGIPASGESDGVTLVEGDVVLATAQASAPENGLWEVLKGTGEWKRPSSYPHSSSRHGVQVPILQGTLYAGSTWIMTNTKFVLVDTEASTWIQNSAGSGVLVNSQELGKEETLALRSGAINLDLGKANVFRAELTGTATFKFINIPTTYPLEATLLVKQDATGGRTWTFTNTAPALEWIGGEPTFETAASSRAVMQMVFLNKGTEILGWAKAGGSIPAKGGKAPVVTKPADQVSLKGVAVAFQIEASESPTGYTATPLPAGLSIVEATGKITGTPTTAETVKVKVTAKNGTGTSPTVEFEWKVTTPSLTLLWGINTNGVPAYSLWQANGVHYIRSRYPGEARLGTDSIAEAEKELVNAQTQAEAVGGKAIIQIDVQQAIALPTPAEYATYAMPLIKKVAEHDGNVVIEIINEPWEKNNHAGVSNAKPYGEIVKKVYEECKAKAITLRTVAGGAGVVLLVASRHYNSEWLKKMKEGLGGGASESFLALNGLTSHPYGTLSLTESNGKTGDTSHNHNWATLIQQHEKAVSEGYPVLATNNWWVTEWGIYIRKSEAEETEFKGSEGEVKDEAARVLRYEEVQTRIHEAREAGWLQAFFPYAQSDAGGQWNICNGEGTGATMKSAGTAYAKTVTTF